MSEAMVDPDKNLSVVGRLMVMAVGERVRREITASDFDQTDSAWAVEMQSALLLPIAHENRGWADLALVQAHPVAWEVLARWCRAQVRKVRFGDSDRRMGQVRRFGHLARRIDTELDRLANHPAFSEGLVVGEFPIIVAFYQIGSGPMAPTPGRAMRLAGSKNGPVRSGLLYPYRKMTDRGVCTEWRAVFTG
jgi:hypothetical protein